MSRHSAAQPAGVSVGPRRYHSPQDGVWYVQLTQGDTYVTGDPNEVLTTILGSCISAGIRDPVAGVGGMNHFLLPEGDKNDPNAQRYGVNAMELLINDLLRRGGMRHRFEAKLFGGGNVMAQLSDVGSRNAAFAEKFLADEGIAVVGGDLRGNKPRRIKYWPVTGRAQQLAITTDAERLVADEVRKAKVKRQVDSTRASDVELF